MAIPAGVNNMNSDRLKNDYIEAIRLFVQQKKDMLLWFENQPVKSVQKRINCYDFVEKCDFAIRILSEQARKQNRR